MKITIDPNMPDLTPEQIEEMGRRAKPVESDPERAKADMLQAKEVVLSPQVLRQLEEMGMTPDELVAMLLKTTGASQ